jgi:hypothetical protein
MISSKITKAEVKANFQDSRGRHFWNSSECYTMGHIRPISMKYDIQTETDTLSLKIAKAGVLCLVKMAAAAMLEIQVHAIKWAISTRFAIETKCSKVWCEPFNLHNTFK